MLDFLLDKNGEIAIVNNDFVLGRSDEQHQQLLLVTQKGEWKENPSVGVGLANYLNDDDIDGMVREVRSEFTKDGMDVEQINFDEETGTLEYDANYKS